MSRSRILPAYALYVGDRVTYRGNTAYLVGVEATVVRVHSVAEVTIRLDVADRHGDLTWNNSQRRRRD
jgi:hypothetical protein